MIGTLYKLRLKLSSPEQSGHSKKQGSIYLSNMTICFFMHDWVHFASIILVAQIERT